MSRTDRTGGSRRSRFELPHWLAGPLVAALLMTTGGCRQDMHDQPKYEPLEASPLFRNGASARSWVEGTVARGMLREDRVFYTGRTATDEFTLKLPIALDRSVLERGQSRYNSFCSPCHGFLGDGNGMVVQRGFKRPQSFHEERLLASRIGYFFHVITNGFGQMSSYASQVPPADRWAIAAYVRTLQMSQSISVDSLMADELEKIEHPTAAETGPQEAH